MAVEVYRIIDRNKISEYERIVWIVDQGEVDPSTNVNRVVLVDTKRNILSHMNLEYSINASSSGNGENNDESSFVTNINPESPFHQLRKEPHPVLVMLLEQVPSRHTIIKTYHTASRHRATIIKGKEYRYERYRHRPDRISVTYDTHAGTIKVQTHDEPISSLKVFELADPDSLRKIRADITARLRRS